MEEWTLTYAEQCQRPFQRPDLSSLLRPVPVVFDLETSGAGRCMPSGCLRRLHALLLVQACQAAGQLVGALLPLPGAGTAPTGAPSAQHAATTRK